MPGSSKIHPAPVVDQVPNQLHGCLDGMWQEDPEKLRAYLAGGDCGDAGFCHGLCPPNMQVAPDSDQRFVAEPNRYVLYVSAGCPFAARPWMVSCALGLVDNGVLRVSRVFPGNSEDGWFMVPVSEEEKKVSGGFEGKNTLGYYRVNVCITILSKIYFYFTAGIVDTMLKKREEQRLR